MNQTFTITFGDQAENHKGMQKIGNLSLNGFSYDDLKNAKLWFENKGAKTELILLNELLDKDDCNEKAYLLIIRKGLDSILENKGTSDDFYKEQDLLEKDKKAFMYGRVVNKHARHNLCFSDFDQEPNYEEKKGRIINFNKLPLLEYVRNKLFDIFGDCGKNLLGEANYYFNEKCGIGWHGDSERKKVIGIRCGKTMPLLFHWFHKNEKIGKLFKIDLNHGDIYVMSEKTTGCDWKCSKLYTLRHSAGSEKYTKL